MAIGFVLIALGIGGLVWSHALAQGWWQGTLQALGVGFIVGGVVDVLAISGLQGIIRAEDQRRADMIADRAAAAANEIMVERERNAELRDRGEEP